MSSARIPRLTAFDSLYLEDNVRPESCEKLPIMLRSLRLNGFKDNHPLVVSEKPDGRFLVLCGNRRTKGLQMIKDEDSAEFARVLPGGKILCHVHKGLTREEEIDLRIDHSDDEDRVPLDKWGEFLAVKQLVFAHPEDTQETVAKKLGHFHADDSKHAGKPNRSWAQPLVYLAALPTYVQDEYRKLVTEGKDATVFRYADIKPLHKVFDEDFAEFPNGDSPTFAAAWQQVLNPAPAEPKAATDKAAPKDLKAATAKTQAQGAASRIVTRLLLAATNQGGDVPSLDAEAAQMEVDSLILADVRVYLGDDDYNQLVAASQKARLDREAQAQETEALETIES